MLNLTAPQAAPLPTLTLSWEIPSVDLHHKWNPRCGQNRALDVGLGSFNRMESNANAASPVYSLYNLAGTNACTWALSDVVHKARMGGDYRSGKFFHCDVRMTGSDIGAVKDYALAIRFDFRSRQASARQAIRTMATGKCARRRFRDLPRT